MISKLLNKKQINMGNLFSKSIYKKIDEILDKEYKNNKSFTLLEKLFYQKDKYPEIMDFLIHNIHWFDENEINHLNENGETILFYFCRNINSLNDIELMKSFLKQNININVKNFKGYTSFMVLSTQKKGSM